MGYHFRADLHTAAHGRPHVAAHGCGLKEAATCGKLRNWSSRRNCNLKTHDVMEQLMTDFIIWERLHTEALKQGKSMRKKEQQR